MFEWLALRVGSKAAPAIVAACLLVAFAILAVGTVAGIARLVSAERDAHWSKAVADANAASTIAAAMRNEDAAAAEAQARALAESATDERAAVLALEAEIRAMQEDPIIYPATRKTEGKR